MRKLLTITTVTLAVLLAGVIVTAQINLTTFQARHAHPL